MSKRALSPSPDISSSSSSSSSSSQSKQRCFRLQLLHGLPSSLLAVVCSFLSMYEVLFKLRSTCHALHDAVTPECLLHSRICIRSHSLAELADSKPSMRALVSRVHSLSVVYRWEWIDVGERTVMLPLQELRSPLDASRFLFPSLSSLHVLIEYIDHASPPPVGQSCLLNLLQLLAARADSLSSSLRRLHVDDCNIVNPRDVEPQAFSSLAGLRALTHCGLSLRTTTALSCSSLLSALSSLQSLTSLDLRGMGNGSPHLLQLLCADAATPLLLRLESLLLPRDNRDDGMDELHHALLCRLGSLPSAPALRHFSGMSRVTHRAAGLVSLFSLPHLRLLRLPGSVRRTQLLAFISDFTSAAPAPLKSLLLPDVQGEPDDLLRQQAAVAEDAAALISAARALLSRFPALRRLTCGAEIASGAVGLLHSRPGGPASGCNGSLYSLTVRDDELSRFPFTAPLSFPLLTELKVDLPMTDAALELLLAACPHLLQLDCTVSESWRVLLIAARCCRSLLDLTVRSKSEQFVRDKAVADCQPDATSPFLPQLIALRLFGGSASRGRKRVVYDFSLLRHFAATPQSQLRRVRLAGRGLTGHHVLSLAGLPRLSHLLASRYIDHEDRSIPEVAEARSRTLQQLRSHEAAWKPGRYIGSAIDYRQSWDDKLDTPPPGPHHQQQSRQRVLDEAAEWPSYYNLLARVDGAEVDTVRAVFFAELRSVLTTMEKSTKKPLWMK